MEILATAIGYALSANEFTYFCMHGPHTQHNIDAQRKCVERGRTKKKNIISNGWRTSFNGVISFEIIIGHKNYENARKVPNLVLKDMRSPTMSSPGRCAYVVLYWTEAAAALNVYDQIPCALCH